MENPYARTQSVNSTSSRGSELGKERTYSQTLQVVYNQCKNEFAMPDDIQGKEQMVAFEESSADLSSEILNIKVNEKVSVIFNVKDPIFELAEAISIHDYEPIDSTARCNCSGESDKKKLRNCEMCGQVTSINCSQNQRPFPEENAERKRICSTVCDICHAKFLYREAMFELLNRLDSKNEQTKVLQDQQKKQESLHDLTLKNLTRIRTDKVKIEQRLQKDKAEIVRMKSEAQKNLDNSQNKKSISKDTLEQMQRENVAQAQEYKDLKEEIKSNQKTINQSIQEILQFDQELQEMKKQIKLKTEAKRQREELKLAQDKQKALEDEQQQQTQNDDQEQNFEDDEMQEVKLQPDAEIIKEKEMETDEVDNDTQAVTESMVEVDDPNIMKLEDSFNEQLQFEDIKEDSQLNISARSLQEQDDNQSEDDDVQSENSDKFIFKRKSSRAFEEDYSDNNDESFDDEGGALDMLDRGVNPGENRLYSSEYEASRDSGTVDMRHRQSSLESGFLSTVSRTSTFELIKETPQLNEHAERKRRIEATKAQNEQCTQQCQDINCTIF